MIYREKKIEQSQNRSYTSRAVILAANSTFLASEERRRNQTLRIHCTWSEYRANASIDRESSRMRAMSNANFSTELVPWKHVSNFVRRTHSRRAFSVNGQSKKVCHSESRRWSGELRRQCKQSLSQALCRIVGCVSHLKKCAIVRAKSSMPARVSEICFNLLLSFLRLGLANVSSQTAAGFGSLGGLQAFMVSSWVIMFSCVHCSSTSSSCSSIPSCDSSVTGYSSLLKCTIVERVIPRIWYACGTWHFDGWQGGLVRLYVA